MSWSVGCGLRFQHGGRLHDLAALAVSALRHVAGLPGFLQRMVAGRAEPFDGGDALAGRGPHGRHGNCAPPHRSGARCMRRTGPRRIRIWCRSARVHRAGTRAAACRDRRRSGRVCRLWSVGSLDFPRCSFAQYTAAEVEGGREAPGGLSYTISTTAAATGPAPTGTMVKRGAGSVRCRRSVNAARRITAMLPDRQFSTSA